MSIRKQPGSKASTRTGVNGSSHSGSNRNGRSCTRCKRFGTFAPNSIVCDRCLGALPLIFTVAVAGTVADDAVIVSVRVVVGGGQR